MRVRRENGVRTLFRGVSLPSLALLAAVCLSVLTGCEPREPRVEEEPERSPAIEDLEAFMEEQRGRNIGEVTDFHISEGIRLTALALEDVTRRTMLAHDRQYRLGMPAPPITPDAPGTRVTPTVPEAAEPRDPEEVPVEPPIEEGTGVEADPGIHPRPVDGAPEDDRQADPQRRPQVPIDERWEQFTEQWPDRRIQDMTREERADLRGRALGDVPVGYHFLVNDAIAYAERIEQREVHPRPTDRVVAAYNNLYVVTRFIVERYYPADAELANKAAQVDIATSAINAERPAVQQEAATHTFFERAYDAINVLDRAAIPFHEAPIQPAEVEDVAEPAEPQV